MMKSKPTKKEKREELNSQVEQFLKQHGEIHQVPMGESGLVDGKYNTASSLFSEPKKTRTSLNHVISAIHERKSSTSQTTSASKVKPRRKKKVIYDDFGDPLRWEWVEE
ncbi:hypothetical protein [Marinomonas epiphytica]